MKKNLEDKNSFKEEEKDDYSKILKKIKWKKENYAKYEKNSKKYSYLRKSIKISLKKIRNTREQTILKIPLYVEDHEEDKTTDEREQTL